MNRKGIKLSCATMSNWVIQCSKVWLKPLYKHMKQRLLEEYFCWVNTLNPEKGSKLADAVTYTKNQKNALCAFVQHGDIPIFTNLAENAIRPFAVGRKNWLFCDIAKGAESSAIVYSMVETAKANGIDPYDYLFYTLSVLPYYGKSVSHERLENLMPWRKEVQ